VDEKKQIRRSSLDCKWAFRHIYSTQYNEKTTTYLVKEAANHKLILCIHDGYYPSGLSRTYPNLMNIEGVAGDESEHSIPSEIKSLHDVMLPFTRGLMGPIDYTPETGRQGKTHAHQMAMFGIYEGRPTMRGGMKQWTDGGPGGKEIEFIKRLPGQFEEKKVFTNLGEYVTVARRKGKDWYIASMSGPEAVTLKLHFDFLECNNKYSACIYADTPGTQQTLYSKLTVNCNTTYTINMEPNGGHLMILTAE
jgi:alpha-glucosidase